MGGMIVHRQYLTQPQGRVEIDWSNPLTIGSNSGGLAKSSRCLVSGDKAETYGSVSDTVFSAGVGKKITSSTTFGRYRFPSIVYPSAAGVTLLVVLKNETVENFGIASAGNAIQVIGASGSSVKALCKSSWGDSPTGNITLPSNGHSCVIVSIHYGTEKKIFLNGKLAEASSFGGSPVASPLHANMGGTQYPDARGVALVWVWKSALRNGMCESLSANPWQIFRHP